MALGKFRASGVAGLSSSGEPAERCGECARQELLKIYSSECTIAARKALWALRGFIRVLINKVALKFAISEVTLLCLMFVVVVMATMKQAFQHLLF